MNKIKSLQVFYNEKKVGTLALLMKNNIVAFEYDNEWINNGFSISPFSLPLKKQVFIPKIDPLMVYMEFFLIVFLMVGEDCLLIEC